VARRRLSRATSLTALAGTAVVVAAVFAVWAALSWVGAITDDGLNTAEARDEALRQGRERMVELTTMDHDDVEAGLRRWLSATTGALHAELANADPTTLTTPEQAGTTVTGRVLHAALSEFDADHGRAVLLAAVEVTSVRAGAEPGYARNRYRARLRHTDEGWKVETFETVAVGGPE